MTKPMVKKAAEAKINNDATTTTGQVRRRNLFGIRLNDEQLRQELTAAWRDQLDSHQSKWNFDFERLRPLMTPSSRRRLSSATQQDTATINNNENNNNNNNNNKTNDTDKSPRRAQRYEWRAMTILYDNGQPATVTPASQSPSPSSRVAKMNAMSLAALDSLECSSDAVLTEAEQQQQQQHVPHFYRYQRRAKMSSTRRAADTDPDATKTPTTSGTRKSQRLNVIELVVAAPHASDEKAHEPTTPATLTTRTLRQRQQQQQQQQKRRSSTASSSQPPTSANSPKDRMKQSSLLDNFTQRKKRQRQSSVGCSCGDNGTNGQDAKLAHHLAEQADTTSGATRLLRSSQPLAAHQQHNTSSVC